MRLFGLLFRHVRFQALEHNLPKQLTFAYSTQSKPLPETASFAMNLFRGKLNVTEILPFPKVLSPDKCQHLQDVLDQLEKFVDTEVDAAKYDSLGKFDETVLSSLGEFGAYGLQAPEQYNGAGLTFSEYARLVSVIGKCDLALGTHLGAHQGIGYKGIVIRREKFAAYCLTEPDTGSDVSSIQTKAELSPDGKHYVLNGTKVWITNGGLADVFTVFAKVPVTDKDGQIKQKMAAFIVERSFGGVTHSEPEKKMGINASNTVTLYFEDCKVPVENVVGQIGDGFKVAVNILNQGRFAMAAALSGTMFATIKQTTQHVLQRKQFGKSLSEYQSVQEKLTNMVLRHYVSEVSKPIDIPHVNRSFLCRAMLMSSWVYLFHNSML
ncbi:hypothetical protein AHF37_07653 [Paragonimus kellicotti]|nr:hypothetical protein AHF37_07653 [Paragonimus kellicotti]